MARGRGLLGALVAPGGPFVLLLPRDAEALVLEIGGRTHRALVEGAEETVVLHDVNMAARFCDEILALQMGRLIARGTPDEIMTPHQLEAIYGIAMDVIPHPVTGHPVSFVR